MPLLREIFGLSVSSDRVKSHSDGTLCTTFRFQNALRHIDFLSALDNGDGYWRDGEWADGGHPNDVGHAAMASAVPPVYFQDLWAC